MGWLFKGSQKATRDKELMIFITPTMMPETLPNAELNARLPQNCKMKKAPEVDAKTNVIETE
ncbi:MAG: hypothetical protein R2827_13055 [Bdellovibrionales bacterium]